jgi:hypothetical protein
MKTREEAPKLQAGSEKKKAHSQPPLTKKQKLGEELDAGMRAVEYRRAMEVMAVHDLAEQKAKETKDCMANRPVDMDKIIAVAHGRRQKSSSGGMCIKC